MQNIRRWEIDRLLHLPGWTLFWKVKGDERFFFSCNIWMPPQESTLAWFVCSFFSFHQTRRTKQQDSSLFRDLIFCEKTFEQCGGAPTTAGPRSQSKTRYLKNFTIKKIHMYSRNVRRWTFQPTVIWKSSLDASVCVCVFCNHGEHSSRKDRGHLEWYPNLDEREIDSLSGFRVLNKSHWD